MSKKMLIDATHAEETRVVVVDGTKVEEFDFETLNKRQLAGNIYLAKVTRVEPSLQAAFVDYGGNRHGFLAFAEIHPDYYQIPAADRKALIDEERAQAEDAAAEDDARDKRSRSRAQPARSGGDAQRSAPVEAATEAQAADEVETPAPAVTPVIDGMEVIDPSAPEDGAEAAVEQDGAAATAEGEGDSGSKSGRTSRRRRRKSDSEPAAKSADSADSGDDQGIESVADEDLSDELPAPRRPRARRYKIQEVIKTRQIMLVQVVKEERGNKGAALTTYLSLAGRYCVLMPNTARGGGISRKITNIADRKKLKEIAGELAVPEGAGLIIRTAGSQRTKTEIKRDYEYLMRLWEQIRDLTFKSTAPAPIYEEGDLIKRSIRDLYSKEINEVLVEGERGYRVAKDFMKMIMPSHAKNVKHYTDSVPLFARHQVESYLAAMFNPTVQLKSGGYIVIGVTEALVAIDVNSGRATKEGSIEETATKTNLEAADEIARQLRLRDLAGLIVIDFIDMDDRKNNAAVEKRMKDRLKSDRARIQVGKISGFGLMEMSRQRLRPGMLESTTQPCPHCHGTGLIRSDDSLALTILRAIEEEGTRKRSREVVLRAPVAVVNFLMNVKREHIALIEQRYGMAVRVEADPALVSPDFALEKFKTATRPVAEIAQVVSVDSKLMAEIDDASEVEDDEDDSVAAVADIAAEAAPSDDEGSKSRSSRRRRRRRKPSRDEDGQSDGTGDDAARGEAEPAEAESGADNEGETEKPSRNRRSRSRSRRSKDDAAAVTDAPAAETDTQQGGYVDLRDGVAEAVEQEKAEAEKVEPKKTKPTKAEAELAKTESAEAEPAEVEATPSQPEQVADKAESAPENVEAEAQLEAIPPAETSSPVAEHEPAKAQPKRRGWWNFGA